MSLLIIHCALYFRDFFFLHFKLKPRIFHTFIVSEPKQVIQLANPGSSHSLSVLTTSVSHTIGWYILLYVTYFCFRLEPQLKQLQTKYDELKERKSSLRNAAYFLSNLKQLYQDYSDVQAKEPNIKETVIPILLLPCFRR